MRLDDDAKVFLFADLTLSVDPTGSTVELEVDSTRYAMTWQGSPASSGGKWTQTARTNVKFAGSAQTVTGGDVKLTAGRHDTQPIVTLSDGQVLAAPADVLYVS
jgi:hypothetical protein